jgi:hypothetical protein
MSGADLLRDAGVSHLVGFCGLLGRCRDDAARKHLIMEAHAYQALNDDETELLIGALLLEAA